MKRRHLLRATLAAPVLGALPAAQASLYVDYFRAVNIDYVGGVRKALERGLDPNTLSEHGQCALYLAIREDCPKVAELLLTWPGIDLNLANAAGETPLMMAALKGNLELMTRLMTLGVPVDKPGWSPLHYAATGKSVAAVRLLLERGATVDARAPNGNTPLMMAARYGDEASVRLLLSRGADLRARNARDQDVLAYATGADREWMEKVLADLLQKSTR